LAGIEISNPMRTAYWAINQEKKETYMSKNLTRKGLALGAVVALGSSLFAGTPALAATAISLDTAFGTSGTTQNGVLGKYFTLASTLTGGAAGDKVKFYVEGVTAAAITAKYRNTTSVTASGSTAYNTTEGASTALDLTVDKVAAVSDASKQATIIPGDAYTAGSIAQVGITLDAVALDATTTIKVTAFIDSGVYNNKPGDAGEVASTPVSITFHKGSTLTATPTIKAITVGSAVKATVAVSNSVNVEQFRATADGGHAEYPFTVAFKENGSTTWASTTAYTGVDAIWNTTDKEFVAAAGNAVAAKTYGATAKINGTDSASATSADASTGDVLTLSAVSIAAGSSYRSTSSTNAPTTADVLRAGAGSFTAESAVATVDAGKSKAGQKVTFKIEEINADGTTAKTSSLASGASIVAGGKTLTDSDTTTTQSITVEVVSDANGDVSLPVTYTGLAADNSIRISATATGATGAKTATALTVVGQTSKPQAVVNAAVAQAGTAVQKFAKGGAISIPFQVVDQFGQVPTGTYQVVFSALTGVNYTATVPVGTDGKLTFAGTSTHTAAATGLSLTATLQKKNTAGDFENVTSMTQTTTIHVGTVQSAKSITIAASSGTTSAVVRALSSALNSGNSALHQGSVAQTTAGGIDLTSTVLDTEGAVAVGVPVTYTATGVLFKAGTNYGLGSITVLTDASGTTGAVSAYSNLVGAVTVTVTSGSATKTQALTFAKPTSGGSTWTVTAPANILPGQSLKVSAVLKDKFGGAVNASGQADSIKVVYTGPGYVTAAMPTTTDSDGVVSFTVLLGAADTGTATVKITYAGADTITLATAADDIVANASIIIGAAPVVASATTAAIAGSTKRMFVSVTGNSTAKNVVVKVAGKTVATLKGSASKKTYTIRATKGSKKVTVFVGGKLIATKTVSVK
jgi:trimeric autotransporter adhesin